MEKRISLKQGLLAGGLVLLAMAVSQSSAWWHHRKVDALGAQIAALSAPGDIEMLSSQTCAYCTRAREWFRTHRVAFKECFIETDADCARRFSMLNAPGTPVIVVRGQAQIGFGPERIARVLAAGG